MDQAARDVEAETQQPQNQQDNENCPKHDVSFSAAWTPASEDDAMRPRAFSMMAIWKQWPAPWRF
jgi:hypothetical protein